MNASDLCPSCGGRGGAHGMVHRRNPQGGGGVNLPCPESDRTLGGLTQMRPEGPDAVRIKVCQTCARTDRYSALRARHYTRGGLCPGPVTELLYLRSDTPCEVTDDHAE